MSVSRRLGRTFKRYADLPSNGWVSVALPILTPTASFLVALDYSSVYKSYPNWRGAIEIADGPAPFIVLLVLGALTIIHTVQERRQRPTVDSLKTEVGRLKDDTAGFAEAIEITIDGLLLILSERLNFAPEGSERVSIYLHSPKKFFFPFGRASNDPELKRRGRTRFRNDQGCIGQAWRNMWHFDNEFPDSAVDRAKYNKRKYNINEDEYSKLKMKPSLIAAMRIDDSDRKPLGVIVVESTKKDAFEKEALRATLSEQSVMLARTIKHLSKFAPNPDEAEESGL